MSELTHEQYDGRIPQDALDMLLGGDLCPYASECNSDDSDSCHWMPDVHAACEDASEIWPWWLQNERDANTAQAERIRELEAAVEAGVKLHAAVVTSLDVEPYPRIHQTVVAHNFALATLDEGSAE